MEEIWKEAIEWVKKQDVRGCITGSSMLGYFEGADVDIFCYDLKSFSQMFFAMYYSDMFHILDPLEQWKADKFRTSKEFDKGKSRINTIKFKYNLSIDVNITYKDNADNIFAVLSSFDMDIVCKGYDIQTKQYLDLSEHLDGNVATWNKWNPSFYSEDVWNVSRLLRQVERCFKYYKRGYNTDMVVYKYLELIEKVEGTVNLFNSANYADKLEVTKDSLNIVKEICKVWLDTHTISEEEQEELRQLIRTI